MKSLRITEGLHKYKRVAGHCRPAGRGRKNGFLVVSTESKALVVRTGKILLRNPLGMQKTV